MAFEPKPGFGRIKRQPPTGNPNAPDWAGYITSMDGEVISFSGWVKTGKAGGKYLSLSVSSRDHTHIAEEAPAPELADAIARLQDYADDITTHPQVSADLELILAELRGGEGGVPSSTTEASQSPGRP